MKLSVLIPYRPDTEHRERVFAFTSRLWKASGVDVIYSGDGLTGLFSYARAINAARKRASGDCFLSYSVDALPPAPEVLAGLEATLGAGTPWAAWWRGQRKFTEAQTAQLLAGADPGDVGAPGGGVSIGREALIAVRADVWDALGGYDERFVGWGPEDKAWYATLKTLYPSGFDQPNDLFRTLWHPFTPRTRLEHNAALFREYRELFQKPGFRRWYSSRFTLFPENNT